MQSEAKTLYDTLNAEGALKKMYGKSMTGNWVEDEKNFTRQFEANEKLFGINAIDLDDDSEDDFLYDDY